MYVMMCVCVCVYFLSLSLSPQPQGVHHLLEKDAFVSILDFLLGPLPKDTPQVTTPPQ